MAEFICTLGTPSGEIVKKAVEGNSEKELRDRLSKEGYKVFTVQFTGVEQGVRILSGRRRGAVRIKLDDFLLFNQQLAALIHAGLPILQSIQMLSRRSANPKLRQVLVDVETRIKSGTPLSEAFAAQGETFPRIYTASILAGERSGNLDEVLRRYVVYTKSIVTLRRKIRSALTYPIILIVSAILLIIVLTTFVIPQFSSLYDSVGSELPGITVAVMAVSSGIRDNILWLAPLVAGLLFGIYTWRKTENGRRIIDRCILKIPLLGDLIKQMTTAQFTRSMATLLAGGITVVDSLKIAITSITNRELLRITEPALPKIREGKPFNDSLMEAGWFPPLATDMIGVGEKSGSLNQMLEEVAGFYDAETEVKLGQLTTFIEPAILIVMGVVVAIILLAIYLPLLQSISRVGG